MAVEQPEKAGWVSRDTAHILIQTEDGKAAIMAAALREVPGISDTASVAGPYNVTARAREGGPLVPSDHLPGWCRISVPSLRIVITGSRSSPSRRKMTPGPIPPACTFLRPHPSGTAGHAPAAPSPHA